MRRNTIVDIKYRCRNRGDWVCVAAAVVRHRVGRGEFHPQLIDNGTQVVGNRISGERSNYLGRLAQRRCHPVDVVTALARASQHRAQARTQTRIAGSSARYPRLLLVRGYPRRRRRYRTAAHTESARWVKRCDRELFGFSKAVMTSSSPLRSKTEAGMPVTSASRRTASRAVAPTDGALSRWATIDVRAGPRANALVTGSRLTQPRSDSVLRIECAVAWDRSSSRTTSENRIPLAGWPANQFDDVENSFGRR